MPAPEPPFETQIIRQFPHPVAKVYRAWTMVEHIEQWFCPSDDVTLEVTQFDLREGGEFRFLYTWPNGVFPVNCKFLTITPEQTLIFTWEPQAPHQDAGKETMVSVFFRSLKSSLTEVEIRHTLFPDDAMRICHHDGWCGTLDRLSRHLQSENHNDTNK